MAVKGNSECQGIKELQSPKGLGATPTNYPPFRPSSPLPLLIHVKDWTRETSPVSQQAVMMRQQEGWWGWLGPPTRDRTGARLKGKLLLNCVLQLTSVLSPCHDHSSQSWSRGGWAKARGECCYWDLSSSSPFRCTRKWGTRAPFHLLTVFLSRVSEPCGFWNTGAWVGDGQTWSGPHRPSAWCAEHSQDLRRNCG